MIYAITDIHGEEDKLHKVLSQFVLKDDDKVIFLGDYVDRGKRSMFVVNIIKKMVERGQAVALKGNHDEMMVKWYRNQNDPQMIWWHDQYMKKTTKNYWYHPEGGERKLQEHVQFLAGLDTSYITETHAFFHSGDYLDPLWGRPSGDFMWEGRYIVHGHTPLVGKPFVGENRCNLDTGACFEGGVLTCGVFEPGKYKPVDFILGD